jgi:hypothetical protein
MMKFLCWIAVFALMSEASVSAQQVKVKVPSSFEEAIVAEPNLSSVAERCSHLTAE